MRTLFAFTKKEMLEQLRTSTRETQSSPRVPWGVKNGECRAN